MSNHPGQAIAALEERIAALEAEKEKLLKAQLVKSAIAPKLPVNAFDLGMLGVDIEFAMRFEVEIDEARMRKAVSDLAAQMPGLSGRFDPTTKSLMLNDEGILVTFHEGEWDPTLFASDWCHMLGTAFAEGHAAPLSVKITRSTTKKSCVIGMVASHAFFDGRCFYDLCRDLMKLYSGEQIVTPEMWSCNGWTWQLPGIGMSIEAALTKGREHHMVPLTEMLQTDYVQKWMIGGELTVLSFTTAEIAELKKACLPPGEPFISSYKCLCALLISVLSEMLHIKRLRTVHMADIRNRVPFFPNRDRKYVANGICPLSMVHADGQVALPALAAEINNFLHDEQELTRQFMLKAQIVADSNTYHAPFESPTVDEDGYFVAEGEHNGPLLCFNSHIFNQDDIQIEGVPVSNMVSPKIAGCPAVFLNAPSSRPGIDIFMSMPPKITATFKEPAWQAKLHAFAPKKQQ